jgi:hypothetical protein
VVSRYDADVWCDVRATPDGYGATEALKIATKRLKIVQIVRMKRDIGGWSGDRDKWAHWPRHVAVEA